MQRYLLIYTSLTTDSLESVLRRLMQFAQENREMVRAEIANDLSMARILKNAYRVAVRTLLARAAPSVGSTVFELYMRYRYGAAPLILDWADEQHTGFSGLLPQGLSRATSGNFEFDYHGLHVVIRPDGTKRGRGADTQIRFNFNNAIRASTQNGRVISHTGPGVPQATIQTRYAAAVSPSSTSAYGRGTTTQDSGEGDTSLGFHEGNHVRDYLAFIERNPLPVFSGTNNMPTAAFRTAMSAYNAELSSYARRIERFSELQTDCVGVTIVDHYNGIRQASPITCP